ncbi:MAG: hypothetical protein E2P02_12510 [Acidobacteria bacterium]|nr:MAG: hypothetical protein E2P02_12510 [Acidobacteriota bacterium]
MNKRHTFATVVSIVLALGSSVAAQQFEIPDWDGSVKFELLASQDPIRPGDTFEVAVVVDIEEGYHLYGPEEPEPSRTEVVVSGDNIKVGEPSFPLAVTRDLSGLGTYALYEGSVAIRIPVTLSTDAVTGEQSIRADVRYQICTDFACSAPASEELELSVTAAPPGSEVEMLYPGIFETK